MSRPAVTTVNAKSHEEREKERARTMLVRLLEARMTDNVGDVDRALRLILSAGLVAWSLGYLPKLGPLPWWSWAGFAAGVVIGLSSLSRACPAYTWLGLNTCLRRA